MNNGLLSEMWQALNYAAQTEIRTFVKHPTERNSCYITGYFAALYQHNLLDTDTYCYWLAAIGQIENDTSLRETVLSLTRGEPK